MSKQATTPAPFAGMTELERATKVVNDAATAIRDLEARADRVFEGWVEARKVAAEVGLAVELEMGSGIAAAFSEYKQREQRRQAEAIVTEEFRRVPDDPPL